MDCSFIIVNFNTCSLLKDCISSIYKHTLDINFEIIVSDNDSKDDSIKMLKENFPNVIILENKANLGFGKANNKALDIAKGKYIFYLNSDTILLNNAVKIFYDYWESSPIKDKIGALGSNLLDKDQKVIHSYGSFLNVNNELSSTFKVWLNVNRFYLKEKLFNKPIPKVIESTEQFYTGNVDYITGADLFIKNNNNARFDENIFLYLEENDLQYKLKEQDLQRIIIDGPKIIHLCGASSSTKEPLDRVRYFTNFSSIQYYISRITYFRNRNTNKIKVFLLKLLTLFIWLNPLIYSKAKGFIKEMWNK